MQNWTKYAARGLTALTVAAVSGSTAIAQEASDVSAYVDNSYLFLIGGLIVMFMAAGFLCLEAGLVRSKNASMQSTKNIALFSVAGLMFWLVGYNVAYPGSTLLNDWIGVPGAMPWTPEESLETGYAASSDWFFQMVFVATAASIVSGTVAERVKLLPFLIFTAVLTAFIYPTVASWEWGGGALDAQFGFSDFAGSTLVHSTGGWAALVGAIIIGPRLGKYSASGVSPMPGSNIPLAALGTFILWFGWFGFNGGSQLAADGGAAMALTVTHISAATASLTWAAWERYKYGKASLVGLVTGTIAGLASITPASGFVGPVEALIIGAIAGVLCQEGVNLVRNVLNIDDTLDVFAVHGIGGIFGTIMIAVFGQGAWAAQLGGLVIVGLFTVIVTTILIKVVGAFTQLRVDEDTETNGLDLSVHGERAYDMTS